MNATKQTRKPKQGDYILEALRQHFLGGDSYIMSDELYGLCKAEYRNLNYDSFQRDVAFLMREGKLHREGRRLYISGTWELEEDAAMRLAELCADNDLTAPHIPETLTVRGITLTPEQRDATEMVLSHRLSTVLGDAGCGKTTMVFSIAQYGKGEVLVCAPTGKAAQNLRERTGLPARTVHSALGKGYETDDEPLPPVKWPFIKTVIVDEASMMTLALLDGILGKVPEDCSVVLVGDPKQLPSVGSGNVIPDLLELGFPSAYLHTNHRQSDAAAGLLNNVIGFEQITNMEELTIDESFVLETANDQKQALLSTARHAVQMLSDGCSFQVLASRNATVKALNKLIQQAWNPAREGVQTLTYQDKTFHSGDKVIITRNNYDLRCWNGDIGILVVMAGNETVNDPNEYLYGVVLEDGRFPVWFGSSDLEYLELAYAITVHKAQGSEFDDILMPLTMESSRMLYRNLFYTAASRARRRVTIYGSRNAVDVALHSIPPQRRSMLVPKTRMRMARP